VADIGNILREARIRRGLTIKDVAEVTKIRARYLEALENDDYGMLPGPTFVAAFLRTYAGFLKLDAENLVGEYRRSYEPRVREEPSLLRVEPSQHSRSRGVGERQKRKHRRNQRGYAFVGILAIVVVALLAWLGANWGKPHTPATLSVQSVPSQETTSTSLSNVSTSTTQAQASTTTSASVVVSGGNVKLVVKVTSGSCWMVVREDSANGAELYAATLSADGQRTFDSSKRYWLRVGLPKLVTLTVNGREIKLDASMATFTVTEAGVQASQ